MSARNLPPLFIWGSPVSRRASAESLAALVVERTGQQAMSGAYFLFISYDRRRVWVLQWDGIGLCVYSKHHLGGRQFPAPWPILPDEGALRMTREEVLSLTEGCSWQGRVSLSPRRARKSDSACTLSRNMRESSHAKPLPGDEP